MSSRPERPADEQRRPTAWDWPRWPWTLAALLGGGIVVVDLLGAPIAYPVQLVGLLLLGVGTIGGAVVTGRSRRP